MRINKRLRWMVAIIFLAVLSLLVLTRANEVRAIFNDMHMARVLLRVESELMQKTPAGQYYETLLWKHNEELGQISSNYPDNSGKIIHALRLFTPALEALVDGKGDTVRITSEQVSVLKEQLDFYVSIGSPALRADIEKEEQRLQLDRFVDMTMNEAWDVINSAWTPDSVAPPMLVPGSDGKWAYYVHNNIYLEYPGTFHAQASESEKDTVYFVASSQVPEYWNPCVMRVTFSHISVDEKDEQNPRSRYSSETVPWESEIQNIDFPGVEFIAKREDWLAMSLHAFQYNEENQLAVHIWVYTNENPQISTPSVYSEMISQRYEYFQHMVDSLRIEPQ